MQNPSAVLVRRRESALPPAALALAVLLAAALILAPACSRKRRDEAPGTRAAIAGLAAVPAQARVVIGFDVKRLGGVPLVSRAVQQMLGRDPALRARLEALVTSCRLVPARDLHQVLLALGADSSQSLMVVRGHLSESQLVSCVTSTLAQSGGSVTRKRASGRTLYRATSSGLEGGDVWFAFGDRDTLVVSVGEDWLGEALSGRTAVTSSARMRPLIDRAGVGHPLWAAALVDPQVGQGLVATTGGAISQPPQAFFAHVDFPTGPPEAPRPAPPAPAGPGSGAPAPGAKADDQRPGLVAELGVVMSAADQASKLVAFARPQLETLSLVAQRHGAGRYVRKIAMESRESTAYLRLSLSRGELHELLSRVGQGGLPAKPESNTDIDTARQGAQDKPPPGGKPGE
jgi:hypothetical protein